MRPWMIAPLVAAHFAVAGCDPALPAVPPGAPVAVVPMRLFQTNASPPHKLVELSADGKLSGPNGEPIGKVSGTKITDLSGKELVSIAADGTIASSEVTRKMKFNEEGNITDEKGLIKLGSDGTVIMVDAGADPTRTPLRFEGYTPAGHRAAELVLVLVAKHLGKVADLGLNE